MTSEDGKQTLLIESYYCIIQKSIPFRYIYIIKAYSYYTSVFADDTNISTQGTTEYELQERLNADLENVHRWLVANKLTLNKTEYIIIGSRQRISNILTDPKIELGESAIKRVNKSKTIGIVIDEHLSWNDQIQNVVTKVSKGIGMLRRIRQFVPKSTLLRIYHTFTIVA